MLNTEGKEPIHFPAKATVFEFDEEVARIFDNMAVRSIPMYEEARRITAELSANIIRKKWNGKEDVCVLDVGSSTGAYYKSLWVALGYEESESIPGLDAVALDKSQPMVAKTIETLTNVHSVNGDILELREAGQDQYDIINMAYVVQFIKPEHRKQVWSTVHHLLKPGGMVILSAKETVAGRTYEFCNDQYIHFREENGYTKEEIEAKTKALRGSMNTETNRCTAVYMNRAGFTDYQELCRWLHFSTVVAFKRG